MADINAGTPTRLVHAKVTLGGDTILNKVDGEIGWSPGWYQGITDKHLGILATAMRQGDEMPCSGRLLLKGVPYAASNDLYTKLKTAPANGLLSNLAIVIDLPDYPGATTGTRITFTYCSMCMNGLLNVRGGAEYDSWEISFVDNEREPTVARYT